ncbi:unnamed protein product [Choristocarpus tenellus]
MVVISTWTAVSLLSFGVSYHPISQRITRSEFCWDRGVSRASSSAHGQLVGTGSFGNQGSLLMQDLSLRTYWDDFYASNSKTAEWHLTFDLLLEPLERLLVHPDSSTPILMVGCGTSTLSESMHNHGWTNITNIDYSDECIKRCQERNRSLVAGGGGHNGMSWLVMDVCNMTFDSNSFHAAIDKGTLDAIACSEAFDWYLPRMAQELVRVLQAGGRWVCVSFTPPGLALPLLQEAKGWRVEVERLSSFWLYVGTKHGGCGGSATGS